MQCIADRAPDFPTRMAHNVTDAPEVPDLAADPLTFPVVGIGGSAGGLQALLSLFEHMPPDPGMAFVVILHLSPDYESNAAAILQRVTTMPVAQVTSSVPIQANHIYVIAPGADLLMNDGHLQRIQTSRPTGAAVAIDVFFRTLAQVHRSRAFCVVLSGTGSDGAVGLSQVKEEGGITFAQSEEDAEHGDMPRAAVATGLVDFVLPAAQMGAKLVELWSNAQHIQLPDVETTSSGVASAKPAEATELHEQVLLDIMGLLKAYTRHDFRHYKRGTVVRRIERRLQVNGLQDLTSYREFLRTHPGEAAPLLQDMLISVTSFFRDASAFDVLAHEIVPKIFEDRAAGEQLRVWVAGCATGEESYSLSMLMREQASGLAGVGHADVQIFATDIDERAIATARRGAYPSGIAADVSPARLQKFFVYEQGQYRVTADVREQVLFATHNLLRDPPFSRLDLICCRNLLIYLDQSAQISALEMFRYALKPGGFLFLGTSESADAAGALFSVVDKKNRIYRVNASSSTRGHTAYLNDRAADSAPLVPAHSPEPVRAPQQPAAAQEHLMALQSVSPASVLIGGDLEVLHLSPTAGRFMSPAGGVPSNNLLNNVEPDLRLELRTALFKAAHAGETVKAYVDRVRPDGAVFRIDIAVHAVGSEAGKAPRTLVVFSEGDASPLSADANESDERHSTHQAIIGKLEEDNKQLKVHLQDTLERSALSNEELKASNEELQAINEELRSATEELETSKEELQSMNEELGTVNHELRTKVEERGQINDDLHNLISSSEIATVFVDSGMCIKRFTPQASKLFSLIASDIGRSLLDITNRLNYGELAADAQAVFKDLRVIEREITTTDGQRFFARILPYRTTSDKIEGAVLTFFDVTALKQAQDQVREGEERLRIAAANTSDFAIITTDEAGSIATWNTGAERIFGYRPDEIVGRPLATIFTPEDRARGVPDAEMRLALEAGRAEDEGWRQRKDGTTFYCSGVLTRLESSVGKGFAKIARDLTGSKRHELARENLLLKEQQASSEARRDVEMKDKFLAVMSHELKQPLNLIQVSAELLTRLPETSEVPAAVRIGTTIQRAVGSQTKIINDLLDLSRARTGKLRLNLVDLNMGELIRSLGHAAAGDLDKKALFLSVVSPEVLMCVCDRVRAEQLVWNLISNAIKFTPEGGRITVTLQGDEKSAKIMVADTGCGIAAEFLPHVFEMFNQAKAQLTPVNSGLGIGLALVQELTHAHGGRVDVVSEGADRGCTFSVWLPLRPTMAVESDSTAYLTAIDLKGWRILMVDDDGASLDAFATLLRLEGATVNTAEASPIALELLEGAPYDLLISDISMPGMDGHAFISEVRRRMPDQTLRAVAMSGYGRAVDVTRALEAGFNAHIPKPASVSQLKAVIAQLIADSDVPA
ncbi:MAG: signal transduction histidine kinase with CheB and CheR [Variovorax sp.]|nr:signal transduction histidine kinase with CheB and CheR [Variovorax sp.]